MKCNDSNAGCNSGCEKHKKCETPTGCGSCCGKSADCGSAETGIKVTSFSMVANCPGKTTGTTSENEKKEDLLNAINDLEIHYVKLYEENTEFIQLTKLLGITNLQQTELLETNLEGCIYENMEELLCDLNEFLKAEKNLCARLSTELDICFIPSEE